MNSFIKKLERRWSQKKYVCVGLDSDFEKIPKFLTRQYSDAEAIFQFNKEIVDATAEFVCAFKMQSSYYEAKGTAGLKALKRTVRYIKRNYPGVPLIMDAKRADIGSTNLGYTHSIFDWLGFDAVTVNPYLGGEALEPFLQRKDKGIIVLAKTSNPGAGEFQDLKVDGQPLYLKVAKRVAKVWNKNGNCCVVVGATYPEELKDVRRIIGDMAILIPGIGVQGGDLANTIKNGRGKNSWGMIINNSRGIIFASNGRDFAEVARQKTQEMDQEIKSVIASD